ncbi:MAG: hypothetical protein EBT13_15855 [Rhodobacteraceae bacterium]|nr:hypothetical protein [Paracoccaceae bacterium]
MIARANLAALWPDPFSCRCIVIDPLLMAIGRLRATLSALEADMGILDLSDAEKTVLAAATLVADEDGLFEIKHLQDHAVAAQLSSSSTFFRALRTLSARGLIGRMTQEKRSAYRLIAR